MAESQPALDKTENSITVLGRNVQQNRHPGIPGNAGNPAQDPVKRASIPKTFKHPCASRRNLNPDRPWYDVNQSRRQVLSLPFSALAAGQASRPDIEDRLCGRPSGRSRIRLWRHPGALCRTRPSRHDHLPHPRRGGHRWQVACGGCRHSVGRVRDRWRDSGRASGLCRPDRRSHRGRQECR